MSAEVRLDAESVEAVARRVAELLNAARPAELLTAAQLAERLGVSRDWVYAHAGELGAIRLGESPRGRLRFPPVDPSTGSRARTRASGMARRKRRARVSAHSHAREGELLPIRGVAP